MSNPENATFYAFKPSGKWKYTGRGYLSAEVFDISITSADGKIEQILRDNDNCWPGMSTRADNLTLVVIPDESCPHGWPQMYVREKWT
jgi:hypothetical protein